MSARNDPHAPDDRRDFTGTQATNPAKTQPDPSSAQRPGETTEQWNARLGNRAPYDQPGQNAQQRVDAALDKLKGGMPASEIEPVVAELRSAITALGSGRGVADPRAVNDPRNVNDPRTPR